MNAFQGYQKLIRMKIEPREAIFLIPRAVKIDILQEYDLYNLLTGYYPLRLCQTAEEEMRRNTLREAAVLKITDQNILSNIALLDKSYIVRKAAYKKIYKQGKNCLKNKRQGKEKPVKDRSG